MTEVIVMTMATWAVISPALVLLVLMAKDIERKFEKKC